MVMRELRILLLVIALSLGSLEVLIYALHLPSENGPSTAAAASLPAPAPPVPSPSCVRLGEGHFPQIGFMQSVPVESPCD
jgi:hypothetical protein